MKVLMSGSHGLIGSSLKVSLEQEGHSVRSLSRRYDDPIDFSGVDAVIHLAGEPIANGRWSEARKERIAQSRIEGTGQLSRRIAESEIKPSVFICASAIGYYGDRGDELLDESSVAGKGFLPEVCSRWESASGPAEKAGVRTVHIRTGIVLSDQGGALKKMLTPFKMGVGGILGHGRQVMSWISLDDELAAIKHIIDHPELRGCINLVSPNPVTNREFTKILGKVLNRPTVAPMPSFAARMLFGEMADALLLSSTRVSPTRLLDSGFSFKHSNLEEALRSILA